MYLTSDYYVIPLLLLVCYVFSPGPDLRGGGQRARASGPPPTRGPSPNPSYFIFGSIDTPNSCVYTTYASLTPRIIFFHTLIQAAGPDLAGGGLGPNHRRRRRERGVALPPPPSKKSRKNIFRSNIGLM